jgi:glutamyl-tRNA(Gln) amidotransferase subunit D
MQKLTRDFFYLDIIFSGEDIVVLKLDNGYNIGVSVEDAELAILSKAKKDKVEFTKKKKNKELKDITVLATGGTIASFVDYKTGAVSPAITAEQLVNSVSALDKVANIDAEPLFSLASEDMAPKHWEGIAKKAKEIHDKKQHGIVIGHGTDTMAYSAAALSFQLPEISNPVIFTGAQRSSYQIQVSITRGSVRTALCTCEYYRIRYFR